MKYRNFAGLISQEIYFWAKFRISPFSPFFLSFADKWENIFLELNPYNFKSYMYVCPYQIQSSFLNLKSLENIQTYMYRFLLNPYGNLVYIFV